MEVRLGLIGCVTRVLFDQFLDTLERFTDFSSSQQ